MEDDPETKWINHETHTKHPLKEVYQNPEFDCKICTTKGRGPQYRCEPCDFNIHPTCGTCPESLLSFRHPEHTLELVTRSSIFDHKCNLCRKAVYGTFYNCKTCKVNIHPLRSQLPEIVTAHPMHPPHAIRLQLMKSKKCDVCDKWCKYWRYFCGICDVHIHVGCLSRTISLGSDQDEGGFGDSPGLWMLGLGLKTVKVGATVAGVFLI